jgi:hypothetical protein
MARRTLRANQRFIARRAVPQLYPADVPLPRERAKAPYSPAEVAGFLALADAQPTAQRRMRAAGMQAVTRAGWQGKADHTAQCARDKRPHRRRGVRGTVVELEQGLRLALLVAACDEQTSGGPGLTPSRATRSSYSITNGKRPVGTCATSGPGASRALSQPVPVRRSLLRWPRLTAS